MWMGWERKRGKLHELNRLLRGATDTSFVLSTACRPGVPPGVRYVITLDADTRLPRDAALRLIGKMAHPLNRPRFDEQLQRVTGGYAILQPRVTPSLPVGSEGSLYQRIFSAPGGIDPYAAAASDVYQDIFGEGSYTGKGIYDVDAFEAALRGRVPENAVLSHDLFEGTFARAGLASDIEVIEDYPARYDVAAKRQHRWTRGDWQLVDWIFRGRTGSAAVPMLGRWKMLDNLRRSLLAPSLLLGFAACWLLPPGAASRGTLLLLAAMVIPVFFPGMFSGDSPPRRHPSAQSRRDAGQRSARRCHAGPADARVPARRGLADGRCRRQDGGAAAAHAPPPAGMDWTTAAQSMTSPRLDLGGSYRQMAGGSCIADAGGAEPARLPSPLLPGRLRCPWDCSG
ncbi:hypothetical protein ACU4GD_37730 [Cupriavidus basilensis]